MNAIQELAEQYRTQDRAQNRAQDRHQDKGQNEAKAWIGDDSCKVCWYAAYTSANREKKIAAELERRLVDYFLPLYSTVRRWKDRRVQLDLPLFPGYVFVHLALRDRLNVLQIPGVVQLVGFGGRATPIAEKEVARVREFLQLGIRAEPHPFLTAGRQVCVKSGPLEGMQGIIIRRKNRNRLVVSFHVIHRSVAVDLDLADLEVSKT
ncbi:MAG TPA: UpxY family transcription antiterminator [Candidatus Acidoferrales bacterium]|nr:UpxY family transcription antiterminator [Candidatus Acidoferrales bacterium]